MASLTRSPHIDRRTLRQVALAAVAMGGMAWLWLTVPIAFCAVTGFLIVSHGVWVMHYLDWGRTTPAGFLAGGRASYPVAHSTFTALVGPTPETINDLPWTLPAAVDGQQMAWPFTGCPPQPPVTDDVIAVCWSTVCWQQLLDQHRVELEYYVPHTLIELDEVSMLLAIHGATVRWRCALLEGPDGPWLVTDTLAASLNGAPLPDDLTAAVNAALPEQLSWVLCPATHAPAHDGDTAAGVSMWHQPSLKIAA